MSSSRHAASLLDLLERPWAHRLRRVSLATELDPDETMAQAAAVALGEVFRMAPRDLRRWPGCVVAAMTWVATAHFTSGAFWPHWWRAARLRGTSTDAAEFGQAFLAALGELGLPSFEDRRRLDSILIHSGIPTHHLPGYFSFLQGDRPNELVRRFTEQGGEHAADFAERCLDLLERLHAPEPDLSGLALPERVVTTACGLLARGLLDLASVRRTELHLDPFGQGVMRVVDGARTPFSPPTAWLAFTRHGTYVPTWEAVPCDAWLVVPPGVKLHSDAPIRVVVESLLPRSWAQWRLLRIEAADATWIATGDGPRRAFLGKDRPVIQTGEPLDGVTLDGLPIVAELPEVRLPDGDIPWSIAVRSGLRTIFSGASAEFWNSVERPVRGTFTITVRGALGRGTRRQVTVMEGLTARFVPPVRSTSPSGLVPCRAFVGETEVVFGPREVSKQVGPYVVTPPHVRVAANGHPWTPGPLQMNIADLDHAGDLRVEIPYAEQSPHLAFRVHGEAVQDLAPSKRGHYGLRKITDTVTAFGGGELTLPDGSPVVVIRAAGSASRLTRRGDRLILEGLSWTKHLTAAIYSGDGPPTIVPVPRDGVIAFPGEVRGVLLAVDDPWAPAVWPVPLPQEGVLWCEIP